MEASLEVQPGHGSSPVFNVRAPSAAVPYSPQTPGEGAKITAAVRGVPSDGLKFPPHTTRVPPAARQPRRSSHLLSHADTTRLRARRLPVALVRPLAVA